MIGGPSPRGTMLGRYQLDAALGAGGMATVYRAHDPLLERAVAIKVLHPAVAGRPEAAARLLAEARALAGLRHPAVLQLHEYVPAAAAEPAYLVMELLTGPSLAAFVAGHGAPHAEVAALVGARVAVALAAAHARGVVHRDVKPENVLLDIGRSGARVVLCDFGIARLAEGAGLTATGALLGSPAYMSPEQSRGAAVDARSDLFSLGALLYFLATGAPPFEAAAPFALMAQVAAAAHRPPSARNPRVPAWLERVIERCLARDPQARYPSAEACAAALIAGLADDGWHDVDAELAAYLAAPGEYNVALEARVLAAARAQAEAARARGQWARALAAANRVLAWRPDDAAARALVASLGRASRGRAVGRVAAAALVALALGAGGWRLWQRGSRRAAPDVAMQHGEANQAADVAAQHGANAAVNVAAQHGNVATQHETARAAPDVAVQHGDVATQHEAAQAAPDVATQHGADVATQHTAPRHSRSHAEAAPAVRVEAPTRVSPEAAATPSVAGPAAAPAPAKSAAAATATLVVAIAPWCDLTVDGIERGRSPQTLTLAPGRHHLACRNPVSGQAIERDLELQPGATVSLRERLYASVPVRARLTRGDAFAVDDEAPAAAARDVAPGRRRVTVYAAGREVETRYLDVRPEGCLLVDTPALHCEKP